MGWGRVEAAEGRPQTQPDVLFLPTTPDAQAGDVRIIRPLVYARERATRAFAENVNLPVVPVGHMAIGHMPFGFPLFCFYPP